MAKKKMTKAAKKPATKTVKKVVKKSVKKVVKKVTKKAGKTKAVKNAKASKKKVNAIPRGYSALTPYLVVDNALKAIEFYKKAFGGKGNFMMQLEDGRISHAELKIGDAFIMLADECPEMHAYSPKSRPGNTMSVFHYTKNVDKTVAAAINAGAELVRPATDMFWGDRMAVIVDPFGHKWTISTHFEDVTPLQVKKRAAAFYSKQSQREEEFA